ncbi:hypothetical protein SH139x_002524 [Planctomycetaceae bacterium SH139]
MKRKRRKKLKAAWAEFQATHQLSDEDVKLARQTGYLIKRFEEMLATEPDDAETSKSERIREVHHKWQGNLLARRADLEAGLITPKKKSPKKETHDAAWADAKKVCRLNMEDIRKAKALDMNPKTLVKNVPSPSQPWKAPVKIWIQDLYEERFGWQPDIKDPISLNTDPQAPDPQAEP